MIIDEKNIEAAKAYLSKRLRAGDKWAAFPEYSIASWATITSFRTFDAVNNFCATYVQGNAPFKFKPIASLLNDFSEDHFKKKAVVEFNKIHDELNKYPIEACGEKENLAKNLARGEIAPVLWKRTLDEANDIETFHVMSVWRSSHPHFELGYEQCLVKSTPNYKESVQYFDWQLSYYSSQAVNEKPDILLIAKLRDKTLVLNVHGIPQENSALLIKGAFAYQGRDNKIHYEGRHVTDSFRPFTLKEPVFAKRSSRSRLEFYDKNLQKISSGDSVEYIALDHFSVRPIEVINTQQKTIKGDEKLNQEEKQQHAKRLRHRL